MLACYKKGLYKVMENGEERYNAHFITQNSKHVPHDIHSKSSYNGSNSTVYAFIVWTVGAMFRYIVAEL